MVRRNSFQLSSSKIEMSQIYYHQWSLVSPGGFGVRPLFIGVIIPLMTLST